MYSTQEASIALKKVKRESSVSPYFLSALVAFLVLHNTTEHSQGFIICFVIKNPLIR